MGQTISLLRGINVSGQKKIKMSDLKSLYESLGFNNVRTYIQSGNVVFTVPDLTVSQVKALLEKTIAKTYGFFVPVEIRTAVEMKKVINKAPFDPILADAESQKHLVTFLSSTPPPAEMKGLQKYAKDSETITLIGKEVFLHCFEAYGKSKLSNNFIEAKLGVSATTRNWKTVKKLLEMANEGK